MRNRGIAIELTSLLDVILILMFLLLLQSSDKVKTASDTAEAVSSQNAALESELIALKAQSEQLSEDKNKAMRRLNGRSIVEENSSIISICIKGEGDMRAILVEALGETLEEISLSWSNRNYAENALNAVLTNNIESTEKQTVFLVFEYDRNIIYQSDYSLITGVIQKHKQISGVYSAEYDISEFAFDSAD